MTKQVSSGPPKRMSDLPCHPHEHKMMLLARATDTISPHATPGVSMQISQKYEKTINFIGNINKSEKPTFLIISKNSSESARLKEASATQSIASEKIALPDRKPCRVASDKINENTHACKHSIAKTCFPLGVQPIFASRVPNARS